MHARHISLLSVAAPLLVASFAAPMGAQGADGAAAHSQAEAPSRAPQLRLATSLGLSPDGKVMAFAHGGDLWSVPTAGGTAKRLTSGPWDDQSPCYSPCGKWIAFMSDRSPDGRFIYLMPSEGGVPQQITSYGKSHYIESWSRDGKSIFMRVSPYKNAFEDTRLAVAELGTGADKRITKPWKILFDATASLSSESPDGKRFLFTRSGRDSSRRAYVGPAARQIWLAEMSEEGVSFERLSIDDDQAQNISHVSPRWINNDEILYTAEFGGVKDVFRRNLATGVSSRVTRYGVDARLGADGVFQQRLSMDGSTLIYRHKYYYWRKDMKSDAAAHRIDIHLPDERLLQTTERTRLNRASDICFTFDGKEMAFAAGGEIWLQDRILREPKRMTHTKGPESNLIFSKDGKRLYFTSHRSGSPDIWVATRKDESKPWFMQKGFEYKQITKDDATELGLSISPNEKRLTFVRNGELVHTALDGTDEKVAYRAWDFPAYSWSPCNRYLVITTRDENYNRDIWIIDAEGQMRPINLSRYPDTDFYGSWSPDGKRIAWLSRRADDEYDVYYVNLFRQDEEMTTDDKKREAAMKVFASKKRPTRRPAPKAAPQAAPKKSAPAKAPSKPAPKQPTPKKKDTPQPAAPTKAVAVVQGKPATPATKPAAKPAQSPQQEPKQEPKKPAQKAPAKLADKPAKPAQKPSKPAKKPAPKPAFEREGLHDRIHRIRIPGNESRLNWSPDGKKLYFTASIGGKGGYYAVTFSPRAGRPTLLMSAPPSNAHWLKSGELAGLIGGEPGTIRDGNKVAKFGFTISHEIDWRDRRELVLNEAWFTMRESFYDPSMNNLDWPAVLRKYAPLARELLFADAFERMVDEMLGELNASHMGYSNPARMGNRLAKPGSDWRLLSFDFGVDFDRDAGGPGLLVSRVIHGSPAQKLRSRIDVGERILSIDGKKIGPDTMLEKHLTFDKPRDVKVEVHGKNGKKRHVTIRPIPTTARRFMLYEDWVRRTRKAVESASKERLGYLHIRGMNTSSLRQMEEDIYAAGAGKDVLLIDVRYNGGGSTADHVLTILCQPSHALTLGNRGDRTGYPQDRRVYATWDKPIVLLCNERSFSNAEILAHAVKTLGRGPVVGERTAGGVISTGGSRLSDGSFVRVPGRGWFVLGTGLDMELNGCMPDHRVEQGPADEVEGRDPQLEKAIEVGLELAEEAEADPKPKLIRRAALGR
jgi:tricorn protease